MSGPELPDDVLEARELRVWRFVLNDLLTNGFVVQERDGGGLAVIDPGDRADDLIEAAQKWGGDVQWILVTHLHGDHCARVDELSKAFPRAQVAAPAGGTFMPDRPVSGGESLDFGSLSVQVAATPGHSPESVSYGIDDQLFVGDFIFRLGSGRTDGARASTEDLFETVRVVFAAMADDVVLWCGHGPPTTVGEERAGNPFWRIALEGEPEAPVDKVGYRGETVPVLAWADDYDGGRKALLTLGDGSRVIVPASQVERR